MYNMTLMVKKLFFKTQSSPLIHKKYIIYNSIYIYNIIIKFYVIIVIAIHY